MPTPVSSARECLAGDAACALGDAVSAARRRAHAQTTSLHVVAALLGPAASSPVLTEALARARSAAYAPRLQQRALELCLGLALDRLPCPAPPDDPPVSNSLMAAVKRSQANQRRNPDTFHLYQQQQQQQGFAGVKVELLQLVLAILDDPVVSRVFADAGFRSCDVKLAVLRPPVLRAARCPPLFLCNLPAFPASPDAAEENCRRVGDALACKKAGQNPILIGVGAAEATKDFTLAVQRQNWSFLPTEIRGIKLVSVERELAEGSSDAGTLVEIGRWAEEQPGVVVSLGDLKVFVERGGDRCDAVTRMLEVNRGRVRMVGWSATYETYMKLLSRYPSLDKEWDLQLLPITSVRADAGVLLPRRHSFMESFIPFGGLFPTAYESKYLLNSPSKAAPRCQHCNDKYEEELLAIVKESSVTVDTLHQTNLPSWLRTSEMGNMNSVLDAAKAADDRTLLTTKVMALQKKWNNYCQHLHCNFQMSEIENHWMVPNIVGFSYVSDREGPANQNCRSPDVNQKQSPQQNQSSISVGLLINSASQGVLLPTDSEPEDNNSFSKLQIRPLEMEQLQRESYGSRTAGLSEDLTDEGASPPSVTSVTTDLVLGTPCETPCKGDKSVSQAQKEYLAHTNTKGSKRIPEFLTKSHSCPGFPDTLMNDACLRSNNFPDSKAPISGVSVSGKRGQGLPATCKEFDPRDFKMFLRSLMEKVGWQEEAICIISQAIARCRSGHERRRGACLTGDIWFHFLGPDKVGKKRIAGALAELIYGSKENFICMDVGFEDSNARPNTIFDQQEINGYDVRFRGKTVSDHIAGELSKKPWSVVFLENVDKADLLVQHSLSQAIKTGKFPDSHGREFSVNNNIFVTTSRINRSWASSPSKGCVNFSEERILEAQAWQMKIVIESNMDIFSSNPDANLLMTSRKEPRNRQAFPCSVFMSKRKLDGSSGRAEDYKFLGTSKRAHKTLNTFLDLNLPVEEAVRNDTNSNITDDNLSVSDNSEAWLEEFFELMDESVNFKPFDFDALADNLMKEISKIVHNTVGSDCILEINAKAMEQMLAAAWLSEDREALNNWLAQVLCRTFIEVRSRCHLLAHTVLKLETCEDSYIEEQAPGILLPSKILVE